MSRIIIGADIVPTQSNISCFEKAKMNDIVDENIEGLLTSVDYRIFNLEVPLSDIENPIKKYGPNLIATTKAVYGLKQLEIDFVTLANNHIMDQGVRGLYSTTEALDAVGIAHAGTGKNAQQACEPYVFELDGKKIGIYCCAEHEFSIVGEHDPGANPFDPLVSLDHISSLKKICDYVICLYHGGKEHYRYPAPYLQKVCRRIVEKGADLVVCQHSHCIGCEEKWRDGTIVYGQGNFIFDGSSSEYWKTSLLICVDIDVEKVTINYIPIIKNSNGVMLANDKVKSEIMDNFWERSESIKKEGFINSAYKKFADTYTCGYMTSTDLFCASPLFRAFNKASGNRWKSRVAEKKMLRYREKLINQYECEAHRELILCGLKEDEG